MKKKGKLYKFLWNKPKYIKFKILKENLYYFLQNMTIYFQQKINHIKLKGKYSNMVLKSNEPSCSQESEASLYWLKGLILQQEFQRISPLNKLKDIFY